MSIWNGMTTIFWCGATSGENYTLPAAAAWIPLPAPLELHFDLLLKLGRPPVPAQEMELDSEELDEDYFQGDELDLNVLLREQILLALPLKPLCREECRGLCRQCGANLNRESCSCAAPGFNSSFAALEKLKND